MSLAIDTETYNAIHYDRRANGSPVAITPRGILLHHGGGTLASDMYELTGKNPKTKVSCWAYVDRLGNVYELGPDNRRYWHAGAPDRYTKRWHGNSPAAFGIYDGNLLLGIEQEHKPGQDWPDVQLDATLMLCRQKIDQYHFPITRIGAHKWYAPSRKSDPADFPDKELLAYIKSFYQPSGFDVRVIEPLGARIRIGPGTDYPIVTTLPQDYVFWSDGTKEGQVIAGEGTWYHFAGPTPEIHNPLGFVFGGICERVT